MFHICTHIFVSLLLPLVRIFLTNVIKFFLFDIVFGILGVSFYFIYLLMVISQIEFYIIVSCLPVFLYLSKCDKNEYLYLYQCAGGAAGKQKKNTHTHSRLTKKKCTYTLFVYMFIFIEMKI